jgi:hypothetical protein
VIVRFGLACDGCGLREDDYIVPTIRGCGDCDRDLCPSCAKGTGHVKDREADVETSPTWREP